MKDLILHIGWRKTGSTSLQAFLASRAAWLAGQGVAYYATRADSIGDISRKIGKGESIEPDRQRFEDWLAQQAAPTILMSSEGLSLNDRGAIGALIRPERWRNLTIVAYLRDQAGYAEGIYKQAVKWGARSGISAYLTPAFLDSADYNLHLAGWEAWAEGQGARLLTRIYQRDALVGGDIRSDFLVNCGFEAPAALPPSVNVSPSRALIDLYLRLPPIHRLQQINREMVASGLPGVTGSGDVLDEGQLQSLRTHFAASNEALRQRRFPERDQLFVDRPRAPPQQADPEALEQLLLEVIRARRGAETAQLARQALQQSR